MTLATLCKNKDYYEGKHEIINRSKKTNVPNNKIVCNHAKDISDTATGYFMGNPIVYTSDDNLDVFTDQLDKMDIDDVDSDNAIDMSIYGRAYEYLYMQENNAQLKIRNLDPRNTFIVYDDTIEENELFAVYYDTIINDVDGSISYIVTVVTQNNTYRFNLFSDESKNELPMPIPHFLGQVPIIEYLNNKDAVGDFEQQISLIDAYNLLMSDRVNDKEQFVNSLLAIYGVLLGDDEDEVIETNQKVKELGVLELPSDAKAEYLTRTFDEAGIEILRKAIKEDIYNFSHVPNLTDENFVGNSSGVAMEYKLLGLEMITKTKTRYYKKGLRKRNAIIAHYLGLKANAIDVESIIPKFSRALPKNLLEIAQMITNLKGSVSLETLLSELPFVEDPQSEVLKVLEENKENIKIQQSVFNNHSNDPIDDEENEDVDDE